MEDIQKTKPDHNIPIQKVGIQNLKLPVYIQQKDFFSQHSVADVDVYVNLKAEAKGIHMSRLVQNAQLSTMTMMNADTINELLNKIMEKSEAERAEIIYKFPYFINKKAPVSKLNGLIHCNVEMKFINYIDDKENESFISVEILTTSLCPCSKEISKYGAHNQRSKIIISGKHKKDEKFWIEDIIQIIEKCSSSEMYSVLKRPDEKYVTERAYENPKFVEDSSRSIFSEILKQNRFSWFVVKVINEESIHCHDAYAELEYGEK